MKLADLQADLMIDAETSDEEDRLSQYEVVIEVSSSELGEVFMGIRGVRWEHHDQRIILEATSL